MIESVKQIKNTKCFIITPQIYKMWDQTWDLLVNDKFKSLPYSDWDKKDSYSVLHYSQNNN